MSLVTVDQARAHCKADAGDDALLAIYIAAAEKACARLANRNLYVDTAALLAAIATSVTNVTDAYAAHTAAIATANALTDADGKAVATNVADAALQAAQIDHENTVFGEVADDDIIAAVLLTVGHFYRNREDVVSGERANAVALPNGAAAIMSLHRKAF